ncbi:MAG: Mur ligase family protein, partial [Flavobacteriales bacterium]|nr:Mur ligase family protein [Flavobacteriales bacterium]
MRIHFIAIGGSAMHNLALTLQKKGHTITGSDDAIYEPSATRLRNAGIMPQSEGWFPEKITKDLDAIILGMHARIDNPELIRAKELNIPIYSYPEFIYKESTDKKRIVVAGSHGKTTITSMILHAMHTAGVKTDYMVGASIEGFDRMVELTKENPYIVIEGDEYLSSPLDMRSKFLHYRPDVAIISGIAWDHMNVFKTYKSYTDTFARFIESMEKGSTLIYNSEDPEVVRVVEETFAQNPTLDVKRVPYATHPYVVEGNKVSLLADGKKYPVTLFGHHNMSNIDAARRAAAFAGVSDEQFYTSLADFKGAKNRLEKMYDDGSTIVFKDFAHAPSKVRATVAAVKEVYHDKHVVCAMELHTVAIVILHYKFKKSCKDFNH